MFDTGLRIWTIGAVLDAALKRLLADKPAVQALLLAAIGLPHRGRNPLSRSTAVIKRICGSVLHATIRDPFRIGAAIFAAEQAAATEALARAVERHGLDALQLYPRAESAAAPPSCTTDRFLGVMLRQAEPWPETTEAPAPLVDPSAEAETARVAFARLMRTSLDIGVIAGNLQRLAREYRRVERRAKALENVLLPEVEAMLKHVVEQLDMLDQEEAVRVRSAGRSRAGAAHRSRSER